jgi:hypothetical protein
MVRVEEIYRSPSADQSQRQSGCWNKHGVLPILVEMLHCSWIAAPVLQSVVVLILKTMIQRMEKGASVRMDLPIPPPSQTKIIL